MITTDRDSPGVRGPRILRLRKPSEFRAVYSDGHKKTSRSFVVFILPTAGAVQRFGLTTPRKLGKAHERNRIRRRVRELLRQVNDVTAPGADIVINPRRSVLGGAFGSLEAELVSLLRGRE